MRKMRAILVMLILLASSVLVLPIQKREKRVADDFLDLFRESDEWECEGRVDDRNRQGSHNEEDEFGGSWYDDFENGSGVEWSDGIIFNHDNSVSSLPPLHRKCAISVSGSDRLLNDYQLKIAVPYDTDMQSDFDDLRFYDSDKMTELAYWRESYAVNISATFWVKVPAIPEVGTTIHMAYGDEGLSSASNGDNTFDFFDDFDGTNIDSGKWSINSVNTITSTVSGGKLRITDATNKWIQDNTDTGSQHQAKWNPTDRFILEWEQEVSDTHLSQMGEVGMGLIGSDNKVSAYAAVVDGVPNNLQLHKSGYFNFVEESTDGSKPTNSPDHRTYRIVKNGNSVSIKDLTDNSVRITGTTTDVSKIAIAVGAYESGNPFLNYGDIYWCRVRKYGSPAPAATIGPESACPSYGYIISREIDIGQNSNQWTLSINKTEPTSTYINASVLDADNNRTIEDFDNLTARTIDLDHIHSLGITSIRLKAYFSSNGSSTPSLNSWGVEWTAENAWRDSFVNENRSQSGLSFKGGQVQLDGNDIYNQSLYHPNATLSSEIIDLPPEHTWSALHFSRLVPDNTYLNITAHDATTGEKLATDTGDLNERTFDLSSVHSRKHTSIYIEANFRSNRTLTPVLHDWAISWKDVHRPELVSLIDTIFIEEDTPQTSVLDLSEHFDDKYAEWEPSVYSIEHMSDTANATLHVNGSFLDILDLSENWTGTIHIIVNCTNYMGIYTLSNEFSLIVSEVDDPPTSELLLPADGSILSNTTVTFRWRGFDIDDSPSDISFRLDLGISETPPIHTTDIKTNHITVYGLTEGQTYYWRIIPDNNGVTGTCLNYSWTFTIVNIDKVPTVRLSTPLNGSIVNITTVNLTWDMVGRIEDEPIYHIYMGPQRDNLSEIGKTIDNWHVLTDLLDNTTYYWRVIPVVDSLVGICTGTWQFTLNTGFEIIHNISIEFDVDRLDIVHGNEGMFNVTLTNIGNVPSMVNLDFSGKLAGFINATKMTFIPVGDTIVIPVTIRDTELISPRDYALVLEIRYADKLDTIVLPVNITSSTPDIGDDDDDDDDDDNDDDTEPTETTTAKGGQSKWFYVVSALAVLFIFCAIGIYLILRNRRGKIIDEGAEGIEADIVRPEDSPFTSPRDQAPDAIHQTTYQEQFAPGIKHDYASRSQRKVPATFTAPPQPPQENIPPIEELLKGIDKGDPEASTGPTQPSAAPPPELPPHTPGSPGSASLHTPISFPDSLQETGEPPAGDEKYLSSGIMPPPMGDTTEDDTKLLPEHSDRGAVEKNEFMI